LFNFFFHQINAALVSKRDLLKTF